MMETVAFVFFMLAVYKIINGCARQHRIWIKNYDNFFICQLLFYQRQGNREKFWRILITEFTQTKVIIGLLMLPVEFFIFNFKFNFQRMRITLLVITLLIFSTVQSQSFTQYDNAGNFSVQHQQDSLVPKKWFFSSYRGLSTSVSFF